MAAFRRITASNRLLSQLGGKSRSHGGLEGQKSPSGPALASGVAALGLMRGITLVPRHGTPVQIRNRLVSDGACPRAQSATSPR